MEAIHENTEGFTKLEQICLGKVPCYGQTSANDYLPHFHNGQACADLVDGKTHLLLHFGLFSPFQLPSLPFRKVHFVIVVISQFESALQALHLSLLASFAHFLALKDQSCFIVVPTTLSKV